MKVFKDVITNDELFSDSLPYKLVKDLYYEVEGKVITISNDIDEKLIGGNKAAEATEEDEGVDSSAVTGINVVISHKLNETGFDKTSFKSWLKDYMKSLKEHVENKNPERVQIFTKGMTDFAKELLSNFDDFRFYLGESNNPEGMIILQNYREDGETPYFIVFKDGVYEEKY